MENFPKLDFGAKLAIGAAGTLGVGAAIVVPTTKQQEKAALDLFDKPLQRLTPQERKAAEFQAGYIRWKGFWESTVYPVTRKLPGAKNPILNPYRGLEPIAAMDDDE
mmetsp:Transcript_22976/g.68317  ORF Transcript_22976/g.68317 Transcript_22976/m.68317 type:complete len:107 (-) Transcript_22976:499-819(-)|eukprot:363885-Chlamydomonas_euryale.AAC.9